MARARGRLKITSIAENHHVNAVPYDDNGTTKLMILVSGRKRGGYALVGGLFGDNAAAFPGHVVRAGMHWVMVFSGLPNVPRRMYWLSVAAISGQTPLPVVSTQIRVDAPSFPLAPPARLAEDITIFCPIDNATVEPTFYASGLFLNAQDPLNATTGATMTNVNGTFNGDRVLDAEIPLDTWVFKFTDLPEGENYTFSVAYQPNHTGSSINVTVDGDANDDLNDLQGPPP